MDNTEIEKKFEIIDKKLEKLPETILDRFSETMNLKITNAIQNVKLDFYKWLVPIILGLLGTMAGVIFSYIK